MFDQGKAEKRKFVSLVEPPRGFGPADCISEVPSAERRSSARRKLSLATPKLLISSSVQASFSLAHKRFHHVRNHKASITTVI